MIELYSAVINKSTIPESWKHGTTIAISKPGGRFKPFTLLETQRKIFEAILLNRISTDTKLSNNQGWLIKESEPTNNLLISKLNRRVQMRNTINCFFR